MKPFRTSADLVLLGENLGTPFLEDIVSVREATPRTIRTDQFVRLWSILHRKESDWICYSDDYAESWSPLCELQPRPTDEPTLFRDAQGRFYYYAKVRDANELKGGVYRVNPTGTSTERCLVHLPRNSYTLLVVAQTNTLR
jgi:hypothetical protein